MSLPINVPVQGAGKIYGESALLVVNPLTRTVTHLVVTENWMVKWQRLVPVEWIESVTVQAIELAYDQPQFEALPLFVAGEFLFPAADAPEGRLLAELEAERACLWPLRLLPADLTPAGYRGVPLTSIDIGRGMTVCTTNGLLGQVAHLMVAPDTELVTHLHVETSTLRSCLIPLSAIQRVESYTIHLNISKQEAMHLPAPRFTTPL